MPSVARLNLYPVKSCDGLSWSEAQVLPTGSLRHDRQFALVDSTGKFINAKRTPLIQRLRFIVNPVTREFAVGPRDASDELRGHLDEQGKKLSDWLSSYFSTDVSIVENTDTGFPDDLEAPGPTVVSTATLMTVASWYPDLSIEDVRRRFRANIEVDGVDPFWEDRLFRSDREPQPFQLGSVILGGTNPCQRCVVPTRDPLSGEVTPSAFAQRFGQLRQETLPAWSPRERFDHYYRLSTNTRLIEHGNAVIRVGDPVALIDA